jgi:SAM-dependent methyltransferase
MKGPEQLLRQHISLFTAEPLNGPVLDVACGDGHNGIFLASKGLSVVLADRSDEALRTAAFSARNFEDKVRIWQVDFEHAGINPFTESSFGAVIVFRYLHRPLMPCIQKALVPNGLLVYETYTVDQKQFGKPRNPDHLLNRGELRGFFKNWIIFHYYEGIDNEMRRAVAQIICKKP